MTLPERQSQEAHQNGSVDEVAFIDASGNLQLSTSPSSTPNVWSSAGALNFNAGSPAAAPLSSLFTDSVETTDESITPAPAAMMTTGCNWRAGSGRQRI